ncbi:MULTISPECIES: peroxiredoxin family protein [Exiguobacterium]|uniref:peroxiredoxin family protein n=1 Tax=Exiguobacterium TaxID=33986 RepID=UPI001BAAC9FF|nr:peroxiredoxin family protein [Exiguobacterium alkaliphilum]QUE87921.1 redoxin domain-containing protein [Exiguobacterium alkaliphilum]
MASSLELLNKTPEITLSRVTGGDFSLKDSMSQSTDWHLIIFFRGSWCSVCVQDLKELESQHGYFQKKGIRLVTISTDRIEDLKKMVEDNALSFPVLHDDSLQSLSDYGVKYHGPDAPYNDHGEHGEPAYFLIDENGRLLYQQIQTSPFGRPTATELRKIVQYIKKNLK